MVPNQQAASGPRAEVCIGFGGGLLLHIFSSRAVPTDATSFLQIPSRGFRELLAFRPLDLNILRTAFSKRKPDGWNFLTDDSHLGILNDQKVLRFIFINRESATRHFFKS